MNRGSIPAAACASAAILAASAWGIVSFLGTGAGVIRGLGLGLLLGYGGGAAELVFVRRALARPLHHAMTIVLAGMGIRLLVLLGGAMLLAVTGAADPSAYALAFLAGFFAFLPVLGAVALGKPRNGEASS